MKAKNLVWTGILNEPKFNALSHTVQCIAHRIIYATDDCGIILAEPDFIKKEAAYYDPKIKPSTIAKALPALEEAGIFKTYTVAGRPYLILSKIVNRLPSNTLYELPPWLRLVRKPNSKRDYELIAVDQTVSDGQCQSVTVNDGQCPPNISETKQNRNGFVSQQNPACACGGGGVSAPPPHATVEEEEVTPETVAAARKKMQEQFDNDHEC